MTRREFPKKVRRVMWFSCGAPSALATKISSPDIVAYCQTNAEHPDNERFAQDVSRWTGHEIVRLQSNKYHDTWGVWGGEKYIAGIKGAPCTRELKVKPRLEFQRPNDTHIFGYTNDANDIARAEALQENWPEMTCEFPLIERGLTKTMCLHLVREAGIALPVTYGQGFAYANCIPCGKATSAAYYALVRKHYPDRFKRFAKLCRKLGVRAARINGERVFVDEIPADHPTTEAIVPACDMLCSLVDFDE